MLSLQSIGQIPRGESLIVRKMDRDGRANSFSALKIYFAPVLRDNPSNNWDAESPAIRVRLRRVIGHKQIRHSLLGNTVARILDFQ